MQNTGTSGIGESEVCRLSLVTSTGFPSTVRFDYPVVSAPNPTDAPGVPEAVFGAGSGDLPMPVGNVS